MKSEFFGISAEFYHLMTGRIGNENSGIWIGK